MYSMSFLVWIVFVFFGGDVCWRPFPVFLAMAASRRRGDPGDPGDPVSFRWRGAERWWFQTHCFLKFIFGEDDPNWLKKIQIGWNHQIDFFSILSRVLQCFARSSLAASVMQKTEDIAFHSFGKVLPEELSMAVLKVRPSIFFSVKNVGFNDFFASQQKMPVFSGWIRFFLGKLWWAVDGTDTGGDSSIFWVVFFSILILKCQFVSWIFPQQQ